MKVIRRRVMRPQGCLAPTHKEVGDWKTSTSSRASLTYEPPYSEPAEGSELRDHRTIGGFLPPRMHPFGMTRIATYT